MTGIGPRNGRRGLRARMAIGLIAASAALASCGTVESTELTAEEEQQIALALDAYVAAEASAPAEGGYTSDTRHEAGEVSSDELTAEDVIETQLSSAIQY